MKKILTLLTVLAATTAFSLAAEGWTDNYEKALAEAKTGKKFVLLDFTGSDWCPWCVKLEKDVFDKPAFKDFAKDNLVLVTVDFPNKKKLADDVVKQNDGLKQKFGAQGFPTIVLVNPEGKEVHRFVGYKPDALEDLKKAVDANKGQ